MRTEVAYKVWNEKKLTHEDLKTFTLSDHQSFTAFHCKEFNTLAELRISDVGFWQFSDHNEIVVWFKRKEAR